MQAQRLAAIRLRKLVAGTLKRYEALPAAAYLRSTAHLSGCRVPSRGTRRLGAPSQTVSCLGDAG